MFFATSAIGRTIEAAPGLHAQCPLCGKRVIAHCGEIVEWHWAHISGSDCDSWSEGETPWHRWWKGRAPAEWREVPLGPHRADIKTMAGVIELQHSHIAPDEIRERESFYEKMIWLLDGRMLSRDVFQFEDLVPRFAKVREGTWRWLWPRRSFMSANKVVFIDLGKTVVQVDRFEDRQWDDPEFMRLGRGFYVHGREASRDDFLRRASLHPVSEEERLQPASIIAEWRIPVRGKTPAPHALERSTLRRREFRDEEVLQRWRLKKKPDDLRLLRWEGDGGIVELGPDFDELTVLGSQGGEPGT